MADFNALSSSSQRAKVVDELRRLLPRLQGLQGRHKTLRFGLHAIDSHLPDGGLSCGALHEIVPAHETALPAAFGFVAGVLARASLPPPGRGRSAANGCRVGVSVHDNHTDPSPDRVSRSGPPLSGEGQSCLVAATLLSQLRPIVFVTPTYGLRPYGLPGRLHGHGLAALGLEPARLILVETSHRKATLWAMEEALRSTAPAAVVGVIDKLELKLSQRLQLAATDAGRLLFLIRPAPTLESSAAATRWRVGTAEAARDRFGLYVRPRWQLHLERARNGRPGQWRVEYDHVAHRFSLAAALADSTPARDASQSQQSIAAHCA